MPPRVTTYYYKTYDAANNELECHNSLLPKFIISTSRRGYNEPNRTLVTCQEPVRNTHPRESVLQGKIDWDVRTISVREASEPVVKVKRTIGEAGGAVSEWTWFKKRYETTYGPTSQPCTATCGGREVAVYCPLQVKGGKFATLSFLGDLSDEEKVFLILALMFYDFQREPVATESSKNYNSRYGGAARQAGVFAGGVAVGFAVNTTASVAAGAITNTMGNCCILQ